MPAIFLRWQNTSLQMTTNLHASTVDFLLGFARLCYHLVCNIDLLLVYGLF